MRDLLNREQMPSPTSFRLTALKLLAHHVSLDAVIGELLFLIAVGAGAAAWLTAPPTALSTTDAVLLVFLAGTVAMSRLWPVRIGRSARLYIASIPLYLLSCLFAPPLVAGAVGVGMLAREISVCRQCENKPGTIMAQVGRWMLLSLGVSAIVHAGPDVYLAYTALLAAFLLWAGDVLTCPFVFTPITGKDPLVTVLSIARQSFAGESMQYLIAMLILLVYRTGILWTGILWVDFLGVLLVLLPILLLYIYLKGEDALRRDALPPTATLSKK